MPFTWVYSSLPGEKVRSEEVQEIRTNSNTLANSILLPTPPSAYSISFSQPLADHIVIQDEVADEIQQNLDILRSENYCRGHYSGKQVSDNANNDQALHTNKCTSLVTGGNTTNHGTYHTSQYVDKHIANDLDKNTTRYAVYHASFNSGD